MHGEGGPARQADQGWYCAGQVRKTVEREVRVLRAVAHVNIVALLDVFRVAGRTHLVFEYVERTVLEALKVHPRGLGGLATRRIMWQLVQAVAYLHSQKVGGLRLLVFAPASHARCPAALPCAVHAPSPGPSDDILCCTPPFKHTAHLRRGAGRAVAAAEARALGGSSLHPGARSGAQVPLLHRDVKPEDMLLSEEEFRVCKRF